MNKKEILEPYKGVRDFYPEDQFVMDYIQSVMSRVCETFGYEHYGASILEHAKLYESKTSQEIVNEQTYTFEDRGGRRVVLRPEMTPSVARMVAKKRRDLPKPLRLYSIPNVFRYERPQKGRLREHWQLNADLFGVKGMEYDGEMVLLAYEIVKEFGANDEDFKIKINSRKVLNDISDSLELSDDTFKSVLSLMDKREKMDSKDYDEKLQSLLQDKKDVFEKELDVAQKEGELVEFKEYLNSIGIENVEIDTSIVRGFDYYTGFVFEMFDVDIENPRSMFGGGRYDNLFEIFSEEEIPAVGFGMGDVTLRDFLETHDLIPEYIPATEVYLVREGDVNINEIANYLRDNGINVSVNYTEEKFDKYKKNAEKIKTPFLLVASKGVFTLFNLEQNTKIKSDSNEDITKIINQYLES